MGLIKEFGIIKLRDLFEFTTEKIEDPNTDVFDRKDFEALKTLVAQQYIIEDLHLTGDIDKLILDRQNDFGLRDDEVGL